MYAVRLQTGPAPRYLSDDQDAVRYQTADGWSRHVRDAVLHQTLGGAREAAAEVPGADVVGVQDLCAYEVASDEWPHHPAT